MAVIFAPERRDPNAEMKYYMMQLARMLGSKRKEDESQRRAFNFAESLMPPQTSMINGQRLFSPGGQDAMQGAFFDEAPATFSQKPGSPLDPMQVLSKALQAKLPMRDALGAANLAPKAGQGFGTQPWWMRGAAPETTGAFRKKQLESKPTKRQELKAEGYGPEEIQRIIDIGHGLKPRATSLKTYNTMDLPGKMKYLSTERERAEGQYYGTPEQLEVRQPKYLDWILKEQAKVEKAMGQKSDLTPAGQDPTPQNKAEYDAIPQGTWFMDTDGKRKRKK